VERYGTITREEVLNPESEIYRFSKDGKEYKFKIYPGDIINTTDTGPSYQKYTCETGAFPVQNKLKEGYEFDLIMENGYIKDIKQITNIEIEYKPPIKFIPGLKTIKNFISTAFQPVGTTLYVFGGAWDYQDIGTSYPGRTLGISPDWVKFFDEQDSNYTYRDDEHKDKSYYPFNQFNEYYYAGLDCSGFVGWAVYNNLFSKSLTYEGFVMGAHKQAKIFAQKNYGTWLHTVNGSTYQNPNYTLLAEELRPGDILSTTGHVMIVLARCDDGSFIIIHSTPSNSKTGYPGGGVQMSAVNPKENKSKNCEAYRLCKYYMEKYFKKWSERYEVMVSNVESVFDFADDEPITGIFHWDTINGIITDPDSYLNKTAKDILKDLFE
jgi:hypothetical protein